MTCEHPQEHDPKTGAKLKCSTPGCDRGQESNYLSSPGDAGSKNYFCREMVSASSVKPAWTWVSVHVDAVPFDKR